MGTSKKILFVDNSRTTRATMQRIFEKNGFLVESVGSGSEAIEKAKTGDYGLIIMDLFMPMMNGYEAAKKIRSLPDPINLIPIIALSASHDQKDMDIAKESGMNEFVVKSSDHATLLEAMRRYQV